MKTFLSANLIIIFLLNYITYCKSYLGCSKFFKKVSFYKNKLSSDNNVNNNLIDEDGYQVEILTGSTENIKKLNLEIDNELKNKKSIAFGSSLFAILLFLYNNAHPTISNVAILHAMEKD